MNHFSFTKLLVADLDASMVFYRDVFGVEEQGRVTAAIAGRKIDEILCKPTAPGGAMFVLLKFEGTAKPAADEVILGFVTDDLDGVCSRAVAAGGRVVEPPYHSEHGNVRVAFVADNEGHLIEVVQP